MSQDRNNRRPTSFFWISPRTAGMAKLGAWVSSCRLKKIEDLKLESKTQHGNYTSIFSVSRMKLGGRDEKSEMAGGGQSR